MNKMRRKKILVKKKLQFLYVGYIIFFILLASAISGISVFLALFSGLGEKLAGIYPQGRLMAIFAKTMLILARNIAILVPLVVVMGLILSHRIAGPLIRIERIIDEIGRGNFKSRLTLRKNDELKEIAEALNRMSELLGSKEISEKESARVIAKDLSVIKNQIEEDSLDKDELLQRVSEIEDAIGKL